jgi:hypothetical protein
MTWEADMLWEEHLQRQAEMLSNTAQGFPVPQESKSPPKKASWPADKVERRKVKDLVPYAKNARTHSEEQIEQIAHAIEQWGWTVPCLVDEKGGLIAGHGRVLAAKQLGLNEVPVVVARGWSAAQKRAYVIADNKLTENGGWDDDLLKVEIGELQGEGFDDADRLLGDGDRPTARRRDGHRRHRGRAGVEVQGAVRRHRHLQG